MLFLFIFYLFLPILLVKSISIPFINNSILRSVYNSNSILVNNRSCDQCLCYSNLSYPALNCFSNNTCLLFYSFPRIYQIEPMSGARLYFPQQVFPNASEDCTPNIDDLLNKLRLADLTSVNISNPLELITDNHGYIVTVDQSLNSLTRFNATNLKRIDNIPIVTTSQMAIGYNNGAYFVKSYTSPLIVIDSTNLIVLNNFTLTSVNRARSLMFLNDGQLMVVTSYGTNSLVFFNRSNVLPINYTYISKQFTNYSGPFGMWRVNDSFFYVTSYDNCSLYSYSSGVNGLWKETFVFTTNQLNNTNGASHVTIDDSNRFWISFGTDTTLIYNQEGTLLGNYTIPNSKIFDIKILDNHVMYFSDSGSGRIIRIDPNIQCN